MKIIDDELEDLHINKVTCPKKEGTDRVYGIPVDFLEVLLSLKGRAHSTVQM